MLILSEQQTFAKLRLAPMDFVELLDKDPEAAQKWIIELQGEREKEPRKKKEKDPNAPPAAKRNRGGFDLSKIAK